MLQKRPSLEQQIRFVKYLLGRALPAEWKKNLEAILITLERLPKGVD